MKWIAVLAAVILSALGGAAPAMAGDFPLIIAHRGASGERPEHTLASYERAIEQGADFIEPDLVFTKDGVLVARHENEISGTTDVADHPEFAERKATRIIDGNRLTGWFTEDFTLAELKTLRAKERLPEIRPANTAYDGQFEVPTLAEVIALVKRKQAETGRVIGLYPEMKHPGYFETLGFDMLPVLLDQLKEAGYEAHDDPVFIQCFEVKPLVRARLRTKLRLVQLISATGGPPDIEDGSYPLMVTPLGLNRVAAYADGIGPDMRLVLNPDGTPTNVVKDAHEQGLVVHPYTLRRENEFLPAALRKGDDPAVPGNLPALVRMLRHAGVDGVFTDNPADVIAEK